METLNELLYNDMTNVKCLINGEHGNNFDHYTEYNKEGERYYFSPYLQFGDHDNSCAVERSNYRVFMDEHKDSEFIKDVSGWYGSSAIAVNLNCTDSEINDKLMSLLNYPCLNDDDVTMLELDMEKEYIDNFIEWDLGRLLKEKYEHYFDHEILDKDKFIELWHECKDTNNTYFEVECGGNGYIDTKKLFEGANFEGIVKIELYYQNNEGEYITEFI